MLDEQLKNLLATTASISTVLQFLSGTITCQRIVRNKSTGEISAFPFVSGCLSTALWLRYGFLIQDTSIILVNTIGVSLFFSYVLVLFLYSIKKVIQVLRQFLLSLGLLVAVLMKLHRMEDGAQAHQFLGYTCMAVTVLFFAAPFATLLQVIRSKSTDSLPYHLIVATFLVSLQWLIYGLMLQDPFIQAPNFLGCVLSGLQLSLFLIYPAKAHGASVI
ncbi:hypothetical protein D910_00840 [Dendroctonus ponderosae]|uniref:Sugar transporter SWEET1 n=1 Tax=Dendroctonus ponderosae TaxID=77166 RepID=U4U0V0_DENPD|nr:hypothetical protein D910_00840 [Dendroctonus ponderosae]